MPLKSASRCKTKACKNKVVSANMHELKHNGKRARSHQQMVAIALSVAGKSKRK